MGQTIVSFARGLGHVEKQGADLEGTASPTRPNTPSSLPSLVVSWTPGPVVGRGFGGAVLGSGGTNMAMHVPRGKLLETGSGSTGAQRLQAPLDALL